MRRGNEELNILLLTVAGTSSRFSKSLGRSCLKCLYYEKDFSESLLSRAVRREAGFDKIIIVGGYKFDELKSAVDAYFSDIKDKIVLIENPFYEKYGSGYSLYAGLKYAVKAGFDRLIFAEGDLWVDGESFEKVYLSEQDAITYNDQVIFADKAVVFYFDVLNNVHYLYDTSHKYLEIAEPFLSVYNSAQIWKFTSYSRVKEIFTGMSEADWQTTNLVFIQKYFGEGYKNFSLIEIKKWLNCNTVEDFYKIDRS